MFDKNKIINRWVDQTPKKVANDFLNRMREMMYPGETDEEFKIRVEKYLGIKD